MPYKIQESRFIFDGIYYILLSGIMRHVYVALIVLASVFSMTWRKIVIQRSLVIHHGISLLSVCTLRKCK